MDVCAGGQGRQQGGGQGQKNTRRSLDRCQPCHNAPVNQNLKPWPVVMGVCVDLIGTALFSLPYGAYTAARAPESDVLVLTNIDRAVVTVAGLVFVTVGGYVAGRRAGVRPVAHGVCVGVVLLAFGVLLEIAVPDLDAPRWLNLLSTLAMVPCGALGGWLASRGPRS